MSLNPYLYFNGQCEEAFKFYEKCLGGKITFMMTYEGSPMAGQAPPGWAKKILHAGLASGDGVLEGCDAPPGEYKKPQSFCVMLRPKDRGGRAHLQGSGGRGHGADTVWGDLLGAAVRHGRGSIRDAVVDQLRETCGMRIPARAELAGVHSNQTRRITTYCGREMVLTTGATSSV
jgi:uncharacterized glyoxalase superfamily protein PhnB